MADVVMLLVIAGVFVLCAAYVAACDRIIGPDPVPSPVPEPEARG